MSKRIPKGNEPVLYHVTCETGHTARLAIVPENFAPEVITHAGAMLVSGANFGGLRFTHDQRRRDLHEGVHITVWHAAQPFTSNLVESLPGGEIRLTTRLLSGALEASSELLQKAADAEQCAAIAIALRGGMKLPGFSAASTKEG